MTTTPEKSYIMGRGKIFLDGEYLGNSMPLNLTVTRKDGKVKRFIEFTLDSFTPENIARWFGRASGSKMPVVKIEFKSQNPVGPRVDFELPRVKLKPTTMLVKNGDDWSKMTFRGKCKPDENGVWIAIITEKTVEVRTEHKAAIKEGSTEE